MAPTAAEAKSRPSIPKLAFDTLCVPTEPGAGATVDDAGLAAVPSLFVALGFPVAG